MTASEQIETLLLMLQTKVLNKFRRDNKQYTKYKLLRHKQRIHTSKASLGESVLIHIDVWRDDDCIVMHWFFCV